MKNVRLFARAALSGLALLCLIFNSSAQDETWKRSFSTAKGDFHEKRSMIEAFFNDNPEFVENTVSGDFLAIDIRKALHHLGEITGEITSDDLLGNIFGKFCIGK